MEKQLQQAQNAHLQIAQQLVQQQELQHSSAAAAATSNEQQQLDATIDGTPLVQETTPAVDTTEVPMDE